MICVSIFKAYSASESKRFHYSKKFRNRFWSGSAISKAAPLYVPCKNAHSQLKSRPIALQRISNWSAFVHLFSSAGKSIPFNYLYSRVLADLYKFHLTSKVYATLTMRKGSLGCKLDWFGLYLTSKQSHYCGSQIKAGILQESISPVQQFDAETCLIPIMITKGPQLISRTNIPLLTPGWWSLCTAIKTAYACGCGNESVHI